MATARLHVADHRQAPLPSRAGAAGPRTPAAHPAASDCQARPATPLLRLRTSVGLEQRVPQEWAKNVRVPTFLYQVRGDTLTDPSDVEAMYDNIPVADKKLQWIEGTTAGGTTTWSSSAARRPCSTGLRGTSSPRAARGAAHLPAYPGLAGGAPLAA